MNRINFSAVPMPIQPVQTKNAAQPAKSAFLEHLQQAETELKVSKHANERLAERNIHITSEEWRHISEKVYEAKRKGVKESLVLMEQAALIVSAKNSTVITAMDRTEAKDQLFTNIDGTIVLS